MDQQQQINEFINRELGQWGTYVVATLTRQIQAKNLILTEETLRSLQFEVLRASAQASASLKLSFQESGRMKDMKALYYKKMPPVSAMEDFVRAIGLDKFSYLPYRPSKKVPTESQLVNRLAWGIAKSRLRSNETKPKKWFAKPFYKTVNVLIENLLSGYSEFASRSITENLNG
jgi:hypothetical protein